MLSRSDIKPENFLTIAMNEQVINSYHQLENVVQPAIHHHPSISNEAEPSGIQVPSGG